MSLCDQYYNYMLVFKCVRHYRCHYAISIITPCLYLSVSGIIDVIVWSCGNWFKKKYLYLGKYFLKSYFWVVILLNCQHVDIFYGGGNIKKTSYLNALRGIYITLICCHKQDRKKYKHHSTTLFVFRFKAVHSPNL